MAATPKPVRKAVKERQAHYREEYKKDPKSISERFEKGKKGAKSVAKRTIKSHAMSGNVSKKGKIASHLKPGMG